MSKRSSLIADPMIAVLILATVSAALFPAVGAASDHARAISNIGIFVLFLVNGMRVPRGEIARGFANWRFFLPLFLWVFGVMSLLGLGFSQLATGFLPPLVALGFLFLGTLPSTIQSAISYTSLAEGNVALSVVGAALINIAGVLVTAPIFAFLSGGQIVEMGNEVILRIGVILILPFLIGQALQGFTHEWVIARKAKIAWLDRAVIGFAVFVAFSGAVEQGLLRMFGAQDWVSLLVLVCAFLLSANIGAWALARVLGLKHEDRIAFLFAGAQKSVAIGAPLAAVLFLPDIAGFVIAPLLLYHLLQLVIAAPIASSLKREPA